MIERPDDAEIARLAEQLGMSFAPERLAEVRSVMELYWQAFDVVAAQPDEPRAEAARPRPAAYRPAPADNPCNAWAYRATVAGTAHGPLAGYTLALKDTIALAGVPMLNGSALFAGHVADMDATVVSRVLDAGGTILGKAQCEDFCVSGGSHTSSLGPVENPYRATATAGGSSSGCAALVSLGAVDMAIGGDQGGSIRIPAAFCGINGMKPSWGLVPYTGTASIETSLDHLGPMTRSVRENALLLSVLAGDDGLDPRQRGVAGDEYIAGIDDGVRGLRIGLLAEGFDWPEMSDAVRDCVMGAVMRLEARGAETRRIAVPLHQAGRAFSTPIEIEGMFNQVFLANGIGAQGRGPYSPSLMAAQEAWRERADSLHDLVKVALLVGGSMKERHRGRYYARAHGLRQRLMAAYDEALTACDVLVMPTLPITAPPIPPRDAPLTESFRAASEMVCNTAQFDVTGHPALSTPCGMIDGLPVGLMIVGRMFAEATLYRVAQALEQAAPWTRC
jgi:amidase